MLIIAGIIHKADASGLDSMLTAYWCFDEINGNVVPDMSGNGYNGRINGTVTSVPGLLGNAVRFRGAMDEYIEIEGFPEFIGNFTISVWAAPDSLPFASDLVNSNPIFSRGYTFINEAWAFWIDYAKMDLLLNLAVNRIDCAHSFPAPLKDGIYYHFVSVYDYSAGEIRNYLNGNFLGKCDYDFPVLPNLEPLYIGSSFPGGKEYYRGDIDEARIYSRVLDEEEIKSLYLLGRGQIAGALPGEVNLGTQFGNKDTTIDVVIKNEGNIVLSGINYRLADGSNFKISGGSSELIPGSDVTLNLNYKTNAYGSYTDMILVECPLNCDPVILKIPVSINNMDFMRAKTWITDDSADVNTKHGARLNIRIENYDTLLKNVNIKGRISFPLDALEPEDAAPFNIFNNTISAGRHSLSFDGIADISYDTSNFMILNGTVLMAANPVNEFTIDSIGSDHPGLFIEGGNGSLTILGCLRNLSQLRFINTPAISVYPNPADDNAFIEIVNGSMNGGLSLFDSFGRRMNINGSYYLSDKSIYTLQLSSLPSGVYNLQANVNGTIVNERLVIAK